MPALPARLLVICEGQTEQDFVETILTPHFQNRDCQAVITTFFAGKGGIIKWPRARRDIVRFVKEDQGRLVTTFVDYYGLPKRKDSAWPGRIEAAQKPPTERGDWVENQILKDLGGDINTQRFIPFVCMHEFEGLLFSDCEAFSAGIYKPELQTDFETIRNRVKTPEDINDSSETAPSKRISKLMPSYQKRTHGPLAALEIGLPKMRSECPHFNQWLTKLEAFFPAETSD